MPLQANRPVPGADGSTRKQHYGDGEQPWDTVKRLGWAPEFAAGNILKYLRRSKDVAYSTESARWYWDELKKLMTRGQPMAQINRTSDVYRALMNELTNDELKLLTS